MRHLSLGLGLGLLFAVLLLPTAPAPAETCMSPFVKRLDRPETLLYVYCVDADARDNDFLAVIDVDMDSAGYGKIINQLDLGSSGNETHHFGYTDDRTHIWGCSLFSNRVFVIDVASDPNQLRPGRVARHVDDEDAIGEQAATPDVGAVVGVAEVVRFVARRAQVQLVEDLAV